MNQAMHSREEYVEQAYFFRVYRERLDDKLPAQEILQGVAQEILSTTRLPYALEFLSSEMMMHGRVSGGMKRLNHYFSSFQTFLMEQAERDKARFDARIALQVLEKEAEYLGGENPTPQGLFLYQFETLSRHRLGYQEGLKAIASVPMFGPEWIEWIGKIRQALGAVEFTEMIYARSEFRVEEVRKRTGDDDYVPSYPVLFGLQEGRIAKANHGRDPLYMFSALQRHLGYPKVPRPKPPREHRLDPVLELRLQQLEGRLKLLEAETSGKFDISEFYVDPNQGDAEG